MYHRRRNYVLGAGQPSDEIYDPGWTFASLLTSGIGMIVGGFAAGYFLTKGSRKVRNGMLGAAAAFGISYVTSRPASVVPVDQSPELEESF